MSDWKRDYWAECIGSAADECGLLLNDEQLYRLVDGVERGHENYGMASGDDVASINLSASKEREIDDLKKSVERERRKVTCRTCNGTGRIRTDGPAHFSVSHCWKCDGDGRHDP